MASVGLGLTPWISLWEIKEHVEKRHHNLTMLTQVNKKFLDAAPDLDLPQKNGLVSSLLQTFHPVSC